jgi:DNA-binding IclR family transcriptional regulator
MATETTLKTVERALRVLEIVAEAETPLQVREVAQLLGHNITSTYHLVNTLAGQGYLAKDAGGRLTVGRKVSLLHSAYLRTSDFGDAARPLIAGLGESSGETVYLTRFAGDASVIEMVVESTRSVRVSGLTVGYSGQEDRRASGKAVLAQLPADRLEAVFTHLHPELAGSARSARLGELQRALSEIRENGYAFDDEEFEEGVCCIAAPYFGAAGEVAGAVAVSAPAQRVALLRDQVRPQVLHTAEQLTELASAR